MQSFALRLYLLQLLDRLALSLPRPCPELPWQTPPQATALARAQAQAVQASPSGKSSLLVLLDHPTTRQHLRELERGAGLSNLSSSALLQMLSEELETAEVVHNFGEAEGGNCGYDMNLTSLQDTPFFLNQWLLQALGLTPMDPANNWYTDNSEKGIFGFTNSFRNVSQPDVATSASRVIYGALNVRRASAGNPQCGPVAAIFARRYVMDNALAAPFDTGYYYGGCCKGQSNSGWPFFSACDAWRGGCNGEQPLGVFTPGLIEHLILPHLKFWNNTAAMPGVSGSEYVHLNLARFLVRLLSRRTYMQGGGHALPLSFAESALGYLEVNPVVNLRLDGLVLLVASFDVWFGTSQGDALRELCARRRWPLAWAHQPAAATWRCGLDPSKGPLPPPVVNGDVARGLEPAAARILDPVVLQKLPAFEALAGGSDEARGAREIFERVWDSVRSSVPAGLTPAQRLPLLEPHWRPFLASLSSSHLAVEPVYARANCDRNADCFAVRVRDGKCLCHTRRTNAILFG